MSNESVEFEPAVEQLPLEPDSGRTPDGAPVEDYDTALPETAQPTAPEPEDAGHLLPQGAWAEVARGAEEAGR